jgi:hypothetical protein
MKELTQYLILISLLIGSSVMLLNFIMPMLASVVFCVSLAGLLIKIINKIINLKTKKND